MKLELDGKKIRLESDNQEEVQMLRSIWKRVGCRAGMVLYPRCLSTMEDQVSAMVLEVGRRDRKSW